jgi:plasmid stabilization system protein ParE
MATIIWSNQAELDYYDNIDYLLEYWGLAATRKFYRQSGCDYRNIEKKKHHF